MHWRPSTNWPSLTMARIAAESFVAVAACSLIVDTLVSTEHVAVAVSIYLIVVIGTTVRGGIYGGLLAAILSFLIIDDFFIPPFQTFNVPEPIDWFVAIAFVGVTLIVGRLVDRARREAREAQRREELARLIGELYQVFGVATNLDDLLVALDVWARRTLRVHDWVIHLRHPSGELEVGTVDDSVECDGEHRRHVSLPVVAGNETVGRLSAVVDRAGRSPLDDTSVQLSLSHGLGAAIARERLRASASEAQVLRQSDELKTTLLSLVGHELRTPLAVLKTAATTIQNDARVRKYPGIVSLSEVIGHEVDRLDHLVRNLLDLSRIEGGALQLSLGWYDLGELAREAVHRLRFVLGGQPVEVDVDEDLPPVAVDYLLIDRVIANLVLNSVHHTPAGRPILTRVTRSVSGVCLTVTDYGPGVPESDLEHIFDRFYRREGPWAGVGLGLALCKAIVEAHGGQIRAERAGDGRGLTVLVDLPMTTRESVPARAESIEVGG